MKQIGPERCIIAATSARFCTWTALTARGFSFERAFGIKKEEIKIMLHDNPANLMYLED